MGESSLNADGEIVTFSTNVMGVTFVPPTAVVGENGRASSTVIVPYGTTVVCQASTGDGGVAIQPVTAPPVHISVPTPAVSFISGGGQVIDVTAMATTTLGAASGVTLAFSTNTMGLAFSPGSVVTDPNGAATAHVLIPFGTAPVVGFVAGGGGAAGIALSASMTTTLSNDPPSAMAVYGGTLITLTATAKSGNVGLAGLPIAFATNASAAVFTPASVPADGNGHASSQTFVPYGSATLAIVSGGGASQVISFADKLPQLAFGGSTVGTPVRTTSGSATTGATYPVSITVTDGVTSQPLAGVPVAFAATGGATFTPSSVLTMPSGLAQSMVFVPDEGGPGRVLAVVTAPGITSQPISVPE